MKLKNIEFGKTDGKNEAELPKFEELFYNYNKIYETLLKPQYFIVSGRRGSGKTTLIEYFLQKNNSNNSFCRKDSYEAFRLNQLIEIKSSSKNKDEYYTIWQWTILIELAKLIYTKAHNLTSTDELSILKSFLENNNFHIQLGGHKTISTINETALSGSLKIDVSVETGNIISQFLSKLAGIFSIQSNKDEKSSITLEAGNYLNYISSLENIILKILKQNENRQFYLIYDELDSFFTTSPEYKKIILDLIRCIENLNNNFRKTSINCKIIICLRSDILNIINYPGLNKLLSDSTLELSWNENNGMSPLIHLIANKISVSNPEKYNGKTPKEIFYSLFENQKIATKKGAKKTYIHLHILKKTLLRPRDIVYFFYCLHKNFGETELIKDNMLFAVEKEYSSYFLKDIRSELCGHFEEHIIDACLDLIKKINKRTFSFQELKVKIKELNLAIDDKTLKNLLEKLFEYGAIGNKLGKGETTRYNWYYLNSSCSFDYNKEIIFHYGLYKILNLI